MRIQILELPSKSVGEVYETPYAVIVSEIPIIGDGTDAADLDAPIVRDAWEQKLLDGGAEWCLFTAAPVELGEAPTSLKVGDVHITSSPDISAEELAKKVGEGLKYAQPEPTEEQLIEQMASFGHRRNAEKYGVSITWENAGPFIQNGWREIARKQLEGVR